MSIAKELRQEASRIADLRVLDIFALAEADLNKSIYTRLRRGQRTPQSDREVDYMIALSQYVKYKIVLQRINKEYKSGNRIWDAWHRVGMTTSTALDNMEHWRTLMDRIEFGFEYPTIVVKSVPTAHLIAKSW